MCPQLNMQVLLQDVLLAHAGEHVIRQGCPPSNLYQAMPHALIHRCLMLGPVRCVEGGEGGLRK